MKKIFLNLPIVLMLIVGVACQNEKSREQADADERLEEKAEKTEDIADDANKDKFNDRKEVKDDADFVADQVAASYADVKLAKLAAERSGVAEIKRIAKMLESDHSKKLEQLQKLASEKSITVPIEADKEAIQTVQELRDEKDAENFNEEWCKEMVENHEESIEEFEEKLENTQDPDLKSWISGSLPEMRAHLDQLKACHDKLKDA